MPSPLGEFIKTGRQFRSWTQTRLADETGVTRTTVARWESGAIVPPMRTLAAIREAIGWDDEQWTKALTLVTR